MNEPSFHLVEMRDPEETNHPDPRMRMTLKDIKQIPWFRSQCDRYRDPIPLAFPGRVGP